MVVISSAKCHCEHNLPGESSCTLNSGLWCSLGSNIKIDRRRPPVACGGGARVSTAGGWGAMFTTSGPGDCQGGNERLVSSWAFILFRYVLHHHTTLPNLRIRMVQLNCRLQAILWWWVIWYNPNRFHKSNYQDITISYWYDCGIIGRAQPFLA